MSGSSGCGCQGGSADKNSDNTKKHPLQRLLQYSLDSVLCGIRGSAVFVMAMASFVQYSIFLALCYNNIKSTSRYVEHLQRRRKARVAMKDSLIPAIEAFVFMPLVFILLHSPTLFGIRGFTGLGIVHCTVVCWAAMFSVCLLLRVLKVVRGCPSVGVPIYKDGFPFPDLHPVGEVEEPACQTLYEYSKLPVIKSFLLAFVLIPLRMLSLLMTLMLFALNILSLTWDVLVDSIAAVSTCIKVRNYDLHEAPSHEYFPNVRRRCKNMWNMVRSALTTDLQWVLTLGAGGVPLLHKAAESDELEGKNSGPQNEDGSPPSASAPPSGSYSANCYTVTPMPTKNRGCCSMQQCTG